MATTTPMSILDRPFSVEPITGIMLPDGIFDTAIFRQRITCHYTNTSGADLTNVSVYFEGVSDPGIVVTARTWQFARIPAGASVLVWWDADLRNATPGKKNVSIIAQAAGSALKREIQRIFVSRTTYHQATDTYHCEVPEGTLKMRIAGAFKSRKHGCDGKKDPGLWVPTRLEMETVPNPAYSGQFGDLPFQDPWWKILAVIVAIVAAIVAIIAAATGNGTAGIVVGGDVDIDPDGVEVECCRPERAATDDLTGHETVAGIASVVCVTAIAVALADDKDPWRRGQEATLPGAGEITLGEKVKAHLRYPDAPKAGKAYPVKVEWTYERRTNARTYTHAVSETRTNIHTLQDVVVDAPSPIRYKVDPFRFTARFIREDGTPFTGHTLFAYALVVSPSGISFRLPLRDDGIKPDEKANDGTYSAGLDWGELIKAVRKQHKGPEALLGYWRIYAFAQDVNDARPEMPPTEAATHIGGFALASPVEVTFDGDLPCPLTANAVVQVVP